MTAHSRPESYQSPGLDQSFQSGADPTLESEDTVEGPLVTVVVAARNAGETIASSIGSILAQSYENLEVVVLDDASDDNTANEVQRIVDSRLRYIRSPTQVGRAQARNLAVQEGSGVFIAVQDADDVSLPHRIETQLRLFASQPDLVAVGGQASFKSPRVGKWRLRTYPTSDGQIRAELMTGKMALCHPTVMIRRSAFYTVGGYNSRYLRVQDLDLMLRLSALGRLAAVEDDLVQYGQRVILPWRTWSNTRTFRRMVLADHNIKSSTNQYQRLIPAPAIYVLSMARRVRIYARSRL